MAYIIDSLTGLVDGDNGSGSRVLSRQAERFDKLQRSRAVQATSTVIPALEWTSGQGSFCDTDTLSLTSRDTADELVADLGVVGVR